MYTIESVLPDYKFIQQSRFCKSTCCGNDPEKKDSNDSQFKSKIQEKILHFKILSFAKYIIQAAQKIFYESNVKINTSIYNQLEGIKYSLLVSTPESYFNLSFTQTAVPSFLNFNTVTNVTA